MKNQDQPFKPVRTAQNGFSLIELMIAIVIAMVVTAGAIAVFGNMRSTYTTQDKLGQLQDSQRLALTVLTTTVQQAGYFIDPQKNTGLPAASQPNKDKSVFTGGVGIVGTSNGGQKRK